MAQFRLPDLGEGLEEAQLVRWLVTVGERIQLNQPICQVETAKALVDVPSPYAGTVGVLHAAPGDTVPVGAPLITIAEEGATSASPTSPPAATATEDAANGQGPVLVGYGSGGPAQAFTRRARHPTSGDAPTPREQAPANTAAPSGERRTEGAGQASPLVRKMARERGIDLSVIAGTGPGGRIRVEDLEAGAPMASATPTPTATRAAASAATDDEERISTVGLRKAIAAKMVRAATTIPHFTEYGLFDATELGVLRARLRDDAAFAGQHVTFLPLLVGALIAAVREYPILNSRWDEEGNAIVLKRAIHVGIATDTERGLVVPVIHNAQRLSLARLAAEAERLVRVAREGKLDARAMTGGTITLTNVGAAGPVETGAPLINPPEVCVVGFGAIKPRPTVVGEAILVRPGAWISMSCDHRVVDGATAARFLGALVGYLEAPERLLRLGEDQG
ncbi:MAG: 2-oxo acid dehydrogenase subunit E2 [Ktedonobacterales bacterium]|nr:2-oxo acid dehydrogenase subunit E2 [Ktedonobacterales bacterium]